WSRISRCAFRPHTAAAFSCLGLGGAPAPLVGASLRSGPAQAASPAMETGETVTRRRLLKLPSPRGWPAGALVRMSTTPKGRHDFTRRWGHTPKSLIGTG